MNAVIRRLAIVGVGLQFFLASAAALAGPFTSAIDEFWITKDGTEIFRDSFADGKLPPSGPDDGKPNANTYIVTGAGGFTSESGGKLTMTPALGAPIGISGVYAEYGTAALRQLATIPANPNFLGQDSSFEIHGLFDMSVVPQISGQSFGINASDRAASLGNLGNGTYVLFVGFGNEGINTGKAVVALRLNNYETNVSTVLAGISIEQWLADADQIELLFSKEAGAKELTASYILYDNGAALFSSEIGGNKSLSVYDGEDFIRANFNASDVVVIPEPPMLALLGVGVVGAAFSRRRRSPA
jgi:hypothetical protein